MAKQPHLSRSAKTALQQVRCRSCNVRSSTFSPALAIAQQSVFFTK